jgi:hypothetical protein
MFDSKGAVRTEESNLFMRCGECKGETDLFGCLDHRLAQID